MFLLSLAMILGPQIISPMILLFRSDYRQATVSYLCGAWLGMMVFMALFVWLFSWVKFQLPRETSDQGFLVLQLIFCGFLILLSIRSYVTRAKAHKPAWMGKLETMPNLELFALGLGLFTIMPGDFVSLLTVAVHMVHRQVSLWYGLGFTLLTVLLTGLPLLLVLTLGKRGQTLVGKIQELVDEKSWLVSIFVYLIFVVLILK